MGVRDLWQVLAPVCERKSLWELQDKTVAIDLSGWVCDSQNVIEHSSQPNMHLRNLFFRTSCLLLLGAHPVFVLEGLAPELKKSVMSQRNISRGFSQSSKASGKRTKYDSIQKKCEEMLKFMGVHCVRSAGEAEALCALLNKEGVVDGCISQDSDCFLYGGQIVYRNFTISASSSNSGQGFSIDVYRMKQVEELLGLSRTKLIGLSLLCGCDYNQGVSGVGKETAVKFLLALDDAEVFRRFQKWRTDPIYERLENERSIGVCDRCSHLGKKRLHDKSGCKSCGTEKSCSTNVDQSSLIHLDPEEQKAIVNELKIRKKALQDDTFPSQDVIDEFTCVKPVPKHVPVKWSQPNLIGFMKFAENQLKWNEYYSLEKFLPLVTRWLILQEKNTSKCPIFPEEIFRTRVLKGVASYEVKWSDREGLFETLITEEDSQICVTIEPKELFNKAFPQLVKDFNEREEAKKLSRRKGKSKSTRASRKIQDSHKCANCGKDLPSKNQRCLCHFVTVKKDKVSSTSSLEDLLDSMSLHPDIKSVLKKQPSTKSSKLMENCKKLEKLLPSPDLDHVFQNQSTPKDKTGSEAAACPEFKNLRTAPVTKAPIFSFENLLGDEKWSAADFEGEEDSDLSDIVQSITGRSHYTRTTCQVKSSLSPTDVKVATTSGAFDTIKEKEDSSEEEAPYTPLLERVKKMEDKKIYGKEGNEFASLKLRRLSMSFDAFCIGENTTSSPITYLSDASITDKSGLPEVTYSLGITNLLENTQ